MERLLTIEDVADLLQMSPRLVEQQIRAGFLEFIRIGNEVRIEPSSLRRYIENQKSMTPLVEQQRLQSVD